MSTAIIVGFLSALGYIAVGGPLGVCLVGLVLLVMAKGDKDAD